MFKTEENFPQLKSLQKSDTIYLDSAATSLKYKGALKEQYDFDSSAVANVHRGSYKLSGEATTKYELARAKVAEYLNCSAEQIVFTKGTTDSVNIVAHSYENKLSDQDAILITEMEHHANLIPWQRLSELTGAKLLFCSVDQKGELDLEEVKNLLIGNSVKIMSLCHVSNTLGTLNPIEEIQNLCKKHQTKLFVDGAQAVSILKPDLKSLDADFYTFSAHKIFGPFGVGVLFVKDIQKLELNQLGGGIIELVDFETSGFLKGPQKMEPGTPNISGLIALSPLMEFLSSLNFEEVRKHETQLLQTAEAELSKMEGFTPIGQSPTKVNILSFNFTGVHANDLCELLDEQGLALRSGHHCTQPLLRKLGHNGCARASFSIYNTMEDVEKLVEATKKSLELLR